MTRLILWLAVIAVVSSCWFHPTTSASADEPKPKDTSTAEDSASAIEKQLAEARLKLAKLELDRAMTVNQRASIYSAATLELLRRNVDIAKARLDALSGTGVSAHAAHLRELEGASKVAELKWENAVKIQETLPDSIDASLVESLRLRAQIARLDLQRARDPAQTATRLDHMQWQLEQLRQELLDLNLRVEELSNPR